MRSPVQPPPGPSVFNPSMQGSASEREGRPPRKNSPARPESGLGVAIVVVIVQEIEIITIKVIIVSQSNSNSNSSSNSSSKY